MEDRGSVATRPVAWQAAFALGIAFSQADDGVARDALAAMLGGRSDRLAVRRHVARLTSVDDETRRRALALLAAVDGLDLSAGVTVLPA